MKIGRRLYYYKTTGKAIIPPLPSVSDDGLKQAPTIEQDLAAYPYLASLTANDVDFVQLEFADTSADNVGSFIVDLVTKTPTYFQRLSLSTDKAQITSNGTDTATITVTIQDTINPHAISFTVNSGTPVSINTANGVATLPITTTVAGDYVIKATSDLYGTNSVTVKGV